MATFWQTPPSQELIPNIRNYRDRVLDAIFDLAQFFAAKMESYAKANAPWTDRTGAARAGLRGFAVRAATYVVIYLVNSVQYGFPLEIMQGGRFGIILRTIQQFHSPIMDAARRLVA